MSSCITFEKLRIVTVESSMANESWESWANHVLKELERLNTNMENLHSEFTANAHTFNKEIAIINQELVLLKYKATLFGAIGASIPIAVSIVWSLVKTSGH